MLTSASNVGTDLRRTLLLQARVKYIVAACVMAHLPLSRLSAEISGETVDTARGKAAASAQSAFIIQRYENHPL